MIKVQVKLSELVRTLVPGFFVEAESVESFAPKTKQKNQKDMSSWFFGRHVWLPTGSVARTPCPLPLSCRPVCDSPAVYNQCSHQLQQLINPDD